jgi:hypothetical protein
MESPRSVADPRLRAALDALVDDVVATSELDHEAAVEAVYSRAEDHLRFLRSAGQDEPAHVALSWVVTAVQEDLIEGGSAPMVVWPACPDHPNHPLWFAPGDSPDAAWTCTSAARVIAELGGLRAVR